MGSVDAGESALGSESTDQIVYPYVKARQVRFVVEPIKKLNLPQPCFICPDWQYT